MLHLLPAWAQVPVSLCSEGSRTQNGCRELYGSTALQAAVSITCLPPEIQLLGSAAKKPTLSAALHIVEKDRHGCHVRI